MQWMTPENRIDGREPPPDRFPAGGQAIKEKGKYVVMWKKSNGRWWAVEDIFNSDMPVAK